MRRIDSDMYGVPYALYSNIDAFLSLSPLYDYDQYRQVSAYGERKGHGGKGLLTASTYASSYAERGLALLQRQALDTPIEPIAKLPSTANHTAGTLC